MGRIKAGALARGLLPFLADNRVHVVPPCVVTPDEAATGLGLLTEVLAEVA
jgi:taurine--2-oxoglutarate transaminase